jgi:transcriptional regulator with XRE-family HTH domain
LPNERSTTGKPVEGIGRRISRKRRGRGLTQQGLAARANVSASLLQKVERGDRAATPSLVAAVAAALHVDPAELYGQPYRARYGGDQVHASIAEIRRALACVDVPPDLDTPPRQLVELAAEVANLRRLQQAARDAQVGARVPAVLAELTVHAYETENPRAWTLLNNAQAIAAGIARRFGYNDLASFGIERAAAAAARSDDPNLPRLAQLSRALLMMTIGAWGPGLKLVQRAADGLDNDTAESRAVHGALQMRAAILCARADRGGDMAGDAWEHWGRAKESVEQLPAQAPDYYGLQFTPVNVDIHGVAVAVELDDPDEAVRRDSDLRQSKRLSTRLPAERRTHHEIDMSRALVSAGKHDPALRRIMQAYRTTSQMTLNHPMARETVDRLTDHYRGLPEELRRLRERMELTRRGGGVE